MKHVLMYDSGNNFTFGITTINLKSTNIDDAKLESILFLEKYNLLDDIDLRNVVIYQINEELSMDDEIDKIRKEKKILENQLKNKKLKEKIYNKFKNR